MKKSRDVRWSELRVGVVIVVTLVLLAVGILQLGSRSGLFTRTYNLYVHLDNSLGLKAGSVVRLAGLDVGNVRDVGFSSPDEKKIVVTLEVSKEYEDRIRADSLVSIKTMGLLGDKYLDISVGSPRQPVLPPGTVLKDVKETQLATVMSGAASGLEGLNVVLGQLRGILGEVSTGNGTVGLLLHDPRLYRQLSESVANLDAVAADLKAGRGTAGKLLQDQELYGNILDVSAKAKSLMDKLSVGNIARLSEDKAFYDNLSEVSANLRDVSRNAKELAENLKGGSIARLSGDKELYAKVERISTRLDTLIGRLDKGEGSAGKLFTDEKLYNSMDKFFSDADELVLDLKKNPKKYIHVSVF